MFINIYGLRFIKAKTQLKHIFKLENNTFQPATVLLFENSTNFEKVNTPKINQNSQITKVMKCEKTNH